MPIIRKGNQFHIQTRHTSYILAVYQEQYLVHLYWGDKLDSEINLEYQIESVSVDRASCFAKQLVKDRWVFEPDLKKEFSGFGKGDYRIPTVHARYADESTVSEFSFDSCRIFEGKKKPEGLPALYALEHDCVQTLELVLKEKHTGLKAVLSYSVFDEYDVITRSIRYENESREPIHLLSAMSMCVDFPAVSMEYIQFPGDWLRERSVECCEVSHGITTIGSNKGFSSHTNNPFMILKEPHTTEDQGKAYAVALVYSGNFAISLEKSSVGTIRLTAGINPFNFDWTLQAGECFQTPEAVMAYSSQGINRLSQIYHKAYRERLMAQRYLDVDRPIVINNWEGTGPDFTEDQLIQIMKNGAEMGAEVFVLDDGWFGRYGNGIYSCGDWFVDEKKLPNGLGYLAEAAKRCGIKMGLWFEPEMMSVTSDLYRLHPDWCLHVKKRESDPIYGRVVLDYSRKDVCDYIVDILSKRIEEAGLSYVKWDCNRYMTETSNQMQAHQYMLGLYRVLETLTERFQDVLFEGCSGGGGRFDAGMLYYMPQTWTSDTAKPEDRLLIQHGTSYGYPPVSMTAHIGKLEVGKISWNRYLEFTALAAMGGNFGLEMDLCLLSESEKEQMKSYVATYKQLRHIICRGTFYRLESPFEGFHTTWEYVSEDTTEAVVLAFQTRCGKSGPQHMIWLKGLDEKKRYQWNNRIYTGQELMKAGIYIEQTNEPYAASLMYFKAVHEESEG